jgi:hypothetical protein
MFGLHWIEVNSIQSNEVQTLPKGTSTDESFKPRLLSPPFYLASSLYGSAQRVNRPAFFIPRTGILLHITAVARRIVKTHPYASSPSGPVTRSLTLVSQERQKRRWDEAMQNCQAALEEFEFLRAEWVIFEEQDRPAYFYWLHAEFGPLIQDIQACFERIQEKRQIIESVERIAEEFDCGFAQAYTLFLEKRAQNEADEPEQEDLFRDIHEDEGDEQEQESESENRSSHEEHAHSEKDSWSHPAMSKVQDPETESNLKALYRKLARQLHPDVSAVDDPILRKRADALWLQVQEAYDQKDLPRLGTLATMFDSLTPEGEKAKVSGLAQIAVKLSDLLASIKRYRRASGSLKRDLNRAKLDPSFGFARTKKTKAMRKRAERDLRDELVEAQEGLTQLEAFIEQWERPVYESRARRSRNARSRSNKARGRARAR